MSTENPRVEVGYLPEITDEEKQRAAAISKQILDQVQESLSRQVDPSARPNFAALEPAEAAPVELKRFLPLVKGGGGYLPPWQVSPDECESALQGFNINLFPRGDIDNFRVTRWALALQKSTTVEGSTAFRKWAPWEAAYYDALRKLETKAQGDMATGQAGGFLAPEIWSQQFIDMLYPAMALSRLPVTRLPMGGRVVHVPALASPITVSYAAENAALTPSQARFRQVSFTARKQFAFVQISNELIMDSAPVAEDVLRRNAARMMAIDRDKMCLLGDGTSGTPVGLLTILRNYQGASLTGTFGTQGAPAFQELVAGIVNVETLNNSPNIPLAQATCTGIVGPVALKQQILSLRDANQRPLYDFGLAQMRGASRIDGSSMLDGLLGVDAWVLSNILGGAIGSRQVFFGDWQHLWIMERQDIEVLASNVAGQAFQNDQTWIRLIARYDSAVPYPEAFYAYTNA